MRVHVKNNDLIYIIDGVLLLFQYNCCNVAFSDGGSLVVDGNPRWSFGAAGVELYCGEGEIMSGFCSSGRSAECDEIVG